MLEASPGSVFGMGPGSKFYDWSILMTGQCQQIERSACKSQGFSNWVGMTTPKNACIALQTHISYRSDCFFVKERFYINIFRWSNTTWWQIPTSEVAKTRCYNHSFDCRISRDSPVITCCNWGYNRLTFLWDPPPIFRAPVPTAPTAGLREASGYWTPLLPHSAVRFRVISSMSHWDIPKMDHWMGKNMEVNGSFSKNDGYRVPTITREGLRYTPKQGSTALADIYFIILKKMLRFLFASWPT